MQFPYYYIGVDSWFDTPRIIRSAINNYTKGMIASVPWRGITSDSSIHSHIDYQGLGLDQIYTASKEAGEELKRLWQDEYGNDETSPISYLSAYGWDSALTLIHALDIYDKQFVSPEYI